MIVVADSRRFTTSFDTFRDLSSVVYTATALALTMILKKCILREVEETERNRAIADRRPKLAPEGESAAREHSIHSEARLPRMNPAILTALVGLVGSLVVAVITYWTTKQREREAEWRKEKLAYYKIFVESLSGIVEGDASAEGHMCFAKATNNLLLFAPQQVIDALNAFRSEIRISNPTRSQGTHDRLLAVLLLAIRRDVGVYPADDPATFKPMLWASGASKDTT